MNLTIYARLLNLTQSWAEQNSKEPEKVMLTLEIYFYAEVNSGTP